MKTFLSVLVLILCFQSFIKADDIRDFEIEGLSIGDKALNYFTTNEINKDKYDIYKNIPYYVSFFKAGSVYTSGFEISDTYDVIKLTFKKNDKTFTIYSLQGIKYYQNNDIENCYPLKDKIVKNFTDEIIDMSKIKTSNHKKEHSGYKGSYTDTFYFTFVDGSWIKVGCYDWSKKEKFDDKFLVGIDSSDFAYDLDKKEYK